jgi:hypothetical protein
MWYMITENKQVEELVYITVSRKSHGMENILGVLLCLVVYS